MIQTPEIWGFYNPCVSFQQQIRLPGLSTGQYVISISWATFSRSCTWSKEGSRARIIVLINRKHVLLIILFLQVEVLWKRGIQRPLTTSVEGEQVKHPRWDTSVESVSIGHMTLQKTEGFFFFPFFLIFSEMKGGMGAMGWELQWTKPLTSFK